MSLAIAAIDRIDGQLFSFIFPLFSELYDDTLLSCGVAPIRLERRFVQGRFHLSKRAH